MSDLRLRPDAGSSARLDELVRTMTERRFLPEWRDDALADRAARAWAQRVTPRLRLLRVESGGADRGELWVVRSDDELGVLVPRLDDPDLAAEVRRLVVDLARAEGCARMGVGVTAGDDAAAALVAAPGFEVASVQMRLDLGVDPARDNGGDPGGEAVVELVAMTTDDYAAWEADEVESYAQARERAGEPRDVALRISAEQHAGLLPDGLGTAEHHFFVGRVAGEPVGTVWIGTERPMAFVYDLTVAEKWRRRGYGSGLMRAGARWARERGAPALGLNVFGYNTGARALYDRLGYEVVETYWSLVL